MRFCWLQGWSRTSVILAFRDPTTTSATTSLSIRTRPTASTSERRRSRPTTMRATFSSTSRWELWHWTANETARGVYTDRFRLDIRPTSLWANPSSTKPTNQNTPTSTTNTDEFPLRSYRFVFVKFLKSRAKLHLKCLFINANILFWTDINNI